MAEDSNNVRVTYKKPSNIVKMKPLKIEEQREMLAERRRSAKAAKEVMVGEWQSNEVTVYDVGEEGGTLRHGGEGNLSGFVDGDETGGDRRGGPEFMAINLISRNKQLIHSQLCSNPPVIIAVPESSEERDRGAAMAADHICAYTRNRYNIIDVVAIATNSVFDYGTGFIKNVYDGSIGDILDYDGEDGLVMEGDNKYSVPRVWDVYLDPNASNVHEIKWIFEDMYLTLNEAIHMFGEDHKKRLEKEIRDVMDGPQMTDTFSQSMLFNTKYKVIKICEYWETGLPENCFQGRHGYCLEDGYVLQPLGPSPARCRTNPKDPKAPRKARLPYSILTYIDIPGSPWGRSPVAYTSRQQEMLNNCIAVMISNAESNGTPKVLLPKMSVDKDAITNNPQDIWEYNVTEGVPPYIIQAASVSQDINNLIVKLEQYINDGWGVNDAMFGKQQREQSALLMQLSTMQGNLIRQRLFDKYVLFVKDIYELQLQYCVEYWETARSVRVVGEDNVLQAKDLMSANLTGGYAIVVEYGQSFALDPITRGEQILRFSELFLQAGMQPRDLVKKLRLTELRGAYDQFKKADERAREIIERITATRSQVSISSKFQDHAGIMAYLMSYVMDKDFDQLPKEIKELINEQIEMRKQAEIENATGGQPAQPGMPGMPMPGGPMPGGDMGGGGAPPMA